MYVFRETHKSNVKVVNTNGSVVTERKAGEHEDLSHTDGLMQGKAPLGK